MAKTKLIRKDWPKVRRFTKKGNTYYEVDCRSVHWTGQKKFSFKEKSQALKRANEIGEAAKKHGFDALNNISNHLADRRLTQLNDDLGLHGKTIDDAAKFYLDHLATAQTKENSPLISKLCEQWFTDKSTNVKKQLRAATLRGIRSHANQFSEDFTTKRIGTITYQEMNTVVDNLKQADGSSITDQTRRNYVSYLRQFLNWCIKNDYTEKNDAKKIEVQVLAKPPKSLTLSQCRDLLKVAQTRVHKPLLGYISICVFAGLRPTEAELLTWDKIEFEHDAIVITPDTTKTKRGRRVELSANLKTWLDAIDRNSPLIPTGFRLRARSLRKSFSRKHGKWTPDVLRHTYATFWLSKYENRNKLAEQMGNSAEVIGKSYLSLATKADAEMFWKLTPIAPKVEQFFEIK